MKKRRKKPSRTVLSVPGHQRKMHIKACGSQADVIMLDLEDSVGIEDKEKARGIVIQSLTELNWGDKTVTFRMNALDTAFGYRDLLEVAENAGHRVDAVVVPKINHPGDIHFVDRLLNGVEAHKHPAQPMGIEASIETVAGMEAISEIARSSERLESLVFGIADYSASIGARLVSLSGHGENESAVYPGDRWHFALSRIVMAAKANELMAIDAPYGNFKDLEGLKQAAVRSCALGADGKWAIHPGQLETINGVFSPSAEDIARAKQVLTVYNQARNQGRGAIAVDGRMVDGATLRLAQRLWDHARHLNLV